MKTIFNFFVFLILSSSVFSQNDLPNVNLNTLEGDTEVLRDMTNKDGITVISLWATWCVPCLKELDAISEIYTDWQDETNVELIAVSVDDSRTIKRVKPLVNGKDWDFKVLLDTNTDLKRALNASSIPLTILVKDNKIVYKHSGYSPGAEYDLYEKIKKLSK
ncbi:MAG: TlpA family protein disulfide reductase [Flavobacteriaceae bacterium]|nr:TlpA family protein disulfide reductase [Flavobacteriaceae bacterium]